MSRWFSRVGWSGRRRGVWVALWLAGTGLSSAAEPTVNYTWTTNYYSVTGATPREVRFSISQSRPWKDKMKWDGLTEWRVTWRFEYRPGPDGCRVTSFTPKAVIKTTLPRWIPPPDATPEMKKSWQRFYTGLARHELGHAAFAFSSMAAMRKKVDELPQAVSCEELRRTIDKLANAVVEEHRKKERDYDVRTRHGQLQGVSF